MVEDLCTAVRFEQIGCGRSAWDGRYDLDTTLSDTNFARNAYRFDKIIVAGHSAGVNFSLAYALTLSDAVPGIVAISGGCIVNDRRCHQVCRGHLERHGNAA
jgi:proline iminopeptidase